MLDLEDRLDELNQLGLHQRMRMVSGPQGPRVVLDGRPVLLLCSGNALGLADHPKVRDVAVAGRPHPGWGQQVVAFVVPVSVDASPDVGEIRMFLADRLAPFKAPRELILVAEIPRTASGKVRRSALPST